MIGLNSCYFVCYYGEIMTTQGCPLCKGDGISSYLQSEKILKCNQCNLVFMSSEQIPDNLDSYYQNNVFYANNAHSLALTNRMSKSAAFYLKTIMGFTKPNPDKLLVDIGSNYGSLLEVANEAGFHSVGLEKNRYLVEIGKERGLDVHDSDLAKLSVSNPINVITALHVIEHLLDPKSFLQTIFNRLEPGGILLIGTPNIESYLAKKDGLSWKYIAYEHLFYFSPKVLSELLSETGFEIIEIKKDNTNLYDQSIKKLLHYLVGKPETRNRFFQKSYEGRDKIVAPTTSIFRRMIKKLLVFIIKILGREDFILIVAKKKNSP